VATSPVVHLLKSDDPTLLADALHALVAELSGGDPNAVEDLGAEDSGVDTAVEAAQTPPFLAERRVVVLREVGRFRTEEVAPLVKYLEDPMPTTVLVLTGGGGQIPTSLLNAVKKAGHVQDVGAGTGKARKQWLEAEALKGPVDLDRDARSLLGEHLGEDVGRLGTLLDALAAAYGEGANITSELLGPFLGAAGSVAPWDLTDAIDRGDTEDALVQLHRMMEAGERHPLVVLATLHRHYTAMLKLDGANVRTDADAAAITGTGPYPAKKALAQTRRLGSAGVARAVTLLADADLDLRGGRAWPEELILEVLVARLSKLGGTRRAAPAGRGR
jgi:DNA polymerase-3 subunit delta